MKTNIVRFLPAFSTIALAIALPFTTMASQPVQWTFASGGNGHYYQAFLVTNGISWQQASNAAASLGGYLATATTAAENDFIYNLASADDSLWFTDFAGNGFGPWLGGFQPAGSPEPAGGWSWVTGEPFSYTSWATFEPSNGDGNEDRIVYFGLGKLKDKTWNDYPGDPAQLSRPAVISYIVEWSSVPPPLVGIRASQVEVCWSSLSNTTYRVEYRSTLTTNTWTTLYNCIASTNSETCILDNLLLGEHNRFYRITATNCVP